MVAKIGPGQSIHRIFNYNENKVKEGAAECIGAANYPVDHDQMSAGMKLKRLLKQIELTTKGKINSVHISLNFDVSENHLSKEKLMAITDTYMQQIGFGEQPYLVYQHFDAGHPHVHVVTTNIKGDGKRLSLHHLAIRKSEPARKLIEESFNLIKAEGRAAQSYKLEPLPAERVQYGKTQTKRAIQNVLDHVVDNYKFTSLAEFNAVLKLYNVSADRGCADSRTFQRNGLLYRILDETGKPVGIPVKASSFYSKPTLKNLEKKYPENEAKRLPHKNRIKNTIDLAFNGQTLSLNRLKAALEKQGIDLVLRGNEAGRIYGVTYIDHKTKCVFNGSSLGKQYSSNAIQERCMGKQTQGRSLPGDSSNTESVAAAKNDPQLQPVFQPSGNDAQGSGSAFGDLLESLLDAEQVSDFVPQQLRSGRRKKRKRNQSNNH